VALRARAERREVVVTAAEEARIDRRRRAVDVVARGACVAATVIAVVPLVTLLGYVAVKGVGALSWGFFSRPSGDPSGALGIENGIIGTLILVALAAAIGVPIGILAGVYLSELGRSSTYARVVRFAADVMSGTPSIVVGTFVYAMIVSRWKWSAWAGGVALAIIMLPTVIRTTEEMLRLVPDTLREGALALGVPRWRTILRVVVRTALPGIATGVMLSIARVAGETAPLLFTAFGNPQVSTNVRGPMASLPQLIYDGARDPSESWHQAAAGASLVLVVLVLVMNIGARLIVRRKK
jgi:phosphate transport system permease protein